MTNTIATKGMDYLIQKLVKAIQDSSDVALKQDTVNALVIGLQTEMRD